MRAFTRRSFLSTSARALGALTLGRAVCGASVSGEARSGFRIFVCDWTLKRPCDPEAFDLAACIGLDGVQVEFGRPTAPAGPLPLFDPALQDRILEAAGRTGVSIASLGLGVLNQVPYKSDPAADQWVLDSVAVLARMKVRVALLAFFFKGDLVGDSGGTAEVIRRLRRLASRAEAAGVTYGIESWLKAPELERILDAVNSPAIQAYYDVGNMQKVGEDVGVAIRRLGRERICQVHLKDYDDLYGKGSMDFPAVRAALDAIGYRNWIGIEGTKTPFGVEPSIRYDLDYLRTVFPKTA